jgi:orotate phosphoribosyltransferase
LERRGWGVADFRQEFIAFAVSRGVIRFGEFKTKAGRLSPYFFNAGLFSDGVSLQQLAQFYAKAIVTAAYPFDMLFGPAYKGIVLAAAVAVALAESGVNVPFAFNRKEAKDHGEGGMTIGAPLQGKVLIVDDVISAGTSVRESVDLIRSYGATPVAVCIALDRMERGMDSEMSAAQEVHSQFHMPVISIASLEDLIAYLRAAPQLADHLQPVQAYRERYGAKSLAVV